MVKLQPFQLDDGYSEFTDLIDTPSSYAGEANKALIVNTTENGLEFGVATGSGLIDGYLPMPERGTDPSYQDNYGSIYTKDVGGVTALFYIDNDGTLSRLDGYDNDGGTGLIDGYLPMPERGTDPSYQDNYGSIYTKQGSFGTELFYIDSSGNVVQITNDGSVSGSVTAVSQLLDYADELQSTGVETFINLTSSPSQQTNTDSGYALDVFLNGARMEYTSVLGVDPNEWTYNSTLNRVEFVATGSADWYLVRYKTAGLMDGYLILEEISDPTELSDSGLLYSKEIDGYTELHYMDDYGLVTQITNKGSPVGGGGNTLDQAYDEGGAGAGRAITADSGAVSIDASGGAVEALDIDGYVSLTEISDPSPTNDNRGFLYTKDIGGTTALFYMDDDGTLSRLDGYDGGGGAGNTLDQAYDEGGAGAGRSITADSGAVSIDASGGTDEALDLDGYVSLTEINDPTPTNDNRGFLYAKDIGGTTALFYMDDDGTLSRLDGYDGGGGAGNTLDQAYDEGGAGAGRSITADSGAVQIDASGDMVLDLDGYVALTEISDPSPLANYGMLYTKDIGGTTALFYMDDDGTLSRLDGYNGGGGAGNTLDQAYDEGGAGAGRSITADSGPVAIDASGNMVLDLDGYVSMDEISDPTNITNKGFVYVKNDDAYSTSELFYMDDSGQITQITQDGYLATYNSLRGIRLLEGVELPQQAGSFSIYAKDSNGVTELFSRDSDNNELQMTIQGRLGNGAVAAPGVAISIFLDSPSTTRTKGDATFSDIDAVFEVQANVPVAGKYMLQLKFGGLYATSDNEARFRVLVDGDAVTTDDKRWEISLPGSARESAFCQELVELSAGSHTFKLQWARPSGSGNVTADTVMHFELGAVLVSGSGAGGNIVTKEVLTANKALNDTEQDILSATFQTVEGENVVVSFLGSVSKPTSGAASCYCWLYLDGSKHHYWISRADAQYATRNLSITVPLLNLSAGSHTVKVTIELYSTETATLVADAGGEEDVACMLSVLQHRGGLVPIRQDGETIVDKPAALDFIGAGVYTVENSGGTARIELNPAITATGNLVRVTADQPASDILIGASYTQFFPDSSGSASLVIPTTGQYRVTFSGVVWGDGSGGTAQLEMRIDEGESGETTVGGDSDDSWRMRVHSGDLSSFTVVGEVELEAGTHTLKVYGKNIVGAGPTVFGTSTAQGVDMVADFMLVSGSGAGGTLVDYAEKTSDQTITPTGTDIKITELDLSVDVSEGETLFIHYHISGSNGSGAVNTRQVLIRVDGGSWEGIEVESGAYGVEHSGTYPLTGLSAGTHTVEFGYRNNTNATTLRGNQLVNGHYYSCRVWAVRHRGGLVPIRQDGETIVDKPAAIDFVGPNVQVTNNGGTASVNFNGVANGLDVTEAELSADFSTSSVTFVDVDNGGGDKLSVDVDVVQNEKIMVLLEGYCLRTSGGNRVDVNYVIDGVSIPVTGLIGETQGSSGWATSLGSYGPVISLAQNAGTITVKVQTKVSSNGVDWKQGAKLKVIRFKGGYVQPENIPILEYNSASVVDVISGPGASSELRAKLNDGRRYTATSPLSVDLTTNGPGGLDTGSEAVSTWYHIYLIPGTTSGSLDAIASERDPDGYDGPDGYDVNRWLGAIYNNSSGNIRQFWQVGDWFYSEADPADNELVLISTGAATKNSWTNLSTALATAIPVDVADNVVVRGYVDGDSGQVNQLHVEPGNPPGFTPSSSNEGDQALCLIRVQDSSQGTATRAIELFDGTLSYYMLQSSGSGDINLGLVATAWRASRLTSREARAQAPYQPDTKSPKGTWSDGYSVDFDARPGQSATTRLTLQDGVQRTMTTGTWDGYTNGVADWGYDEAGSQGNSKWLYFYAVPKSGDDDSLVVRASDNSPSTGPAGYSNWKMVWATYIDSSGDLLKVYQRGNSFRLSESIVDTIGSGTDGSPVSYSLTSYVPDSAGDVRLFVYNNGDGTNYRYVDFWADGDQGNATSALRVVCEERQTTAFELATPTSPKKIYYQRDNVTACSFFFTGWVDEWIDP